MKYLIIFMVSMSLVGAPVAPAMAEVGGTITRSATVSYEQLSYQEKLQYIMERLLVIQALLNTLREAHVGTSPGGTTPQLTEAIGTINLRSGLSAVDVTHRNGMRERVTFRTTNEDEIVSALAAEYTTPVDRVRTLTRFTTLYANEAEAIVVRFRDNRSISIRQDRLDGQTETITISSAEIIDELLVPVVGSRSLAQTIYDAYVADVRRGNANSDTYEFIGELLGQPVTPEFIAAISFEF